MSKRSLQPDKRHFQLARLIFLICALLLKPASAFTALSGPFNTEISGVVKSLNFFTLTTGLTPELADNPLAIAERGEKVFRTMERARLKFRLPIEFDDETQLLIKIDYDHQAEFGSFVSTGDYRLAEKWQEQRQFLDLSQTFVEEESARYMHRLYRASFTYRHSHFNLEVGRQQIPWGVGHFFTPTDVFNPFSPTQVELEERDGVDAVHLTTSEWNGYHGEFVYTPRGKRLHPQRIMGRIAKDVGGYEIGLLGGRYWRDHILGFDAQGNLGNAVIRGEGIFQEADEEKEFFKYTVNIDYNFPGNVLAGLEYHFNSQGRRNHDDYQLDRFVRGDIMQLGMNYGALLIQKDINALWKVSNRLMMNLDDVSLFIRPELQYEAVSNLFVTGAAQLYLGDSRDEYGRGQNLYLAEVKYSF